MKTGISYLKLNNFRSYDSLQLNFGRDGKPVVFLGPNGVGKTNILEAISYLTAGRGLRSAKLPEIIRQTDKIENKTWTVTAEIYSNLDDHKIGTGLVEGKERRQIHIDDKPITKQSELANIFRCLWLTPAQDRLFCGDPNARRRFLDRIVQAFDPNHANRLTNYNTALKQWLFLLREQKFDNRWLESLELQLVENGIAIAASRLDITERISGYLNITEDKNFPSAEIQLLGFIEKELISKSAISVEEKFMNHLKQTRKICAEGGNLTGPHTSDFIVIHKQQNRSADLCSTGEQKALLISIILAEMRAQIAEQNKCPVLLLDEVSAHLDKRRRNTLFEIILTRPSQVFMTTTEEDIFSNFAGQIDRFDVQENHTILKLF